MLVLNEHGKRWYLSRTLGCRRAVASVTRSGPGLRYSHAVAIVWIYGPVKTNLRFHISQILARNHAVRSCVRARAPDLKMACSNMRTHCRSDHVQKKVLPSIRRVCIRRPRAGSLSSPPAVPCLQECAHTHISVQFRWGVNTPRTQILSDCRSLETSLLTIRTRQDHAILPNA